MVRYKKNPKKTVAYMSNNLMSRAPKQTFREMIRLQQSTDMMIPKLPFARLVREILQQHGDFRVQLLALQALQESAELYLTELFTDSQKASAHARRVTVKPLDIQLVLNLRGPLDPASRHLLNK